MFTARPDLGKVMLLGMVVFFISIEIVRGPSDPVMWSVVGAFVATGMIILRQTSTRLEAARALAETTIRAGGARFESLNEQSSDVISVIDASGKVLYQSRSIERVFGYSILNLSGRNLLKFLHPDSSAEARELVGRLCLESGLCGRLELRVRHKNGQYIDVEAVITNLLDDPNIAGIVINSWSIVERKLAIGALRESEARLRQSQQLEAVGKLAVSVAHDFNNRLAVIIGYSDMLLSRTSSSLTENAQRKIAQISQAGHQAAALNHQVQALSRKQVLQADTDAAVPASSPVAMAETTVAVEDKELALRMAGKIQMVNDGPVIEVSNQTEALDTLLRHEGVIDLIVTEAVIPVMPMPELA